MGRDQLDRTLSQFAGSGAALALVAEEPNRRSEGSAAPTDDTFVCSTG